MRFVIKREKVSASYDMNGGGGGSDNVVMPFEKDASDEFYKPQNLNRSPVEAFHRGASPTEPINVNIG